MDQGDFPKQVSLGPRAVVWVKSQIHEWCLSKISDTQDKVTTKKYDDANVA